MEKYFYLNPNNEQAGPVSPADFNRYGINENTMIWKQGMPNWMRAGQIPELSQYFSPVAPPPPVNGNPYPERATGNYGYNMGGMGGQYRPIKPDNNMVWAVLATLFCCIPLGIYSIIQASKVNGLYNSGNYDEAQRMADDAKKWACISAVIGLICNFLSFLFMIAAA